MNPVAIFRHFHTEGPGYFATFLERHGIPWQLIRIDAGDAVPPRASAFSGVVFMGGPMSVNDDLPWIAPALARTWPATVSQIVIVMLGSAVCGQIAADELSYYANLIQSRNFRAFEAYMVATAIYLLLAITLRALLMWVGPRFLFGRSGLVRR